MVFDSSTVILLAKIDLFEKFVSNYQGEILIPDRVRAEICVKGREETPLLIKLIKEKKVNVKKIKKRQQIIKVMEDFNIDRGEAEALMLAIQEKAEAVATDDRNATRACKMLKINFVTAIAFLIRSFEKKLISKDEALLKLRKLQSFGRYGKSILEDATNRIKRGGV